MLFLGTHIIAPLVFLIAIGFATRFPTGMAILMLFCGPFAGTVVMLVLGEATKGHPYYFNILGALPLVYVYAVAIFGMWVAVAGTIAWCFVRSIDFVGRMSIVRRVWAGAGTGVIVGPILNVAFWALALLDPAWPVGGSFGLIFSDWKSLLGLVAQGVVAGAICGIIVAWYLKWNLEPQTKIAQS